MIPSLLLVAISVVLFIYYKPHRSVKREKAAYTLTVSQLVEAFVEDETEANALYLDKVVEVSGLLKELIHNEGGMVLLLGDPAQPTGISCYLQKDQIEAFQQLKRGDRIQVKGICTGMLLDVVLDKCVIVTGK